MLAELKVLLIINIINRHPWINDDFFRWLLFFLFLNWFLYCISFTAAGLVFDHLPSLVALPKKIHYYTVLNETERRAPTLVLKFDAATFDGVIFVAAAFFGVPHLLLPTIIFTKMDTTYLAAYPISPYIPKCVTSPTLTILSKFTLLQHLQRLPPSSQLNLFPTEMQLPISLLCSESQLSFHRLHHHLRIPLYLITGLQNHSTVLHCVFNCLISDFPIRTSEVSCQPFEEMKQKCSNTSDSCLFVDIVFGFLNLSTF